MSTRNQEVSLTSIAISTIVGFALMGLQLAIPSIAKHSGSASKPGKVAPPAAAEPQLTVEYNPETKLYSLNGRLEELGGKDSRLPVGMTLKGLKALDGHTDPSAPGGPPNLRVPNGSISYPVAWTGRWGGYMRADRLSGLAGDNQTSFGFNLGESGVVVLSFVPDTTKVVMMPTDIFFSKRDMPVESVDWSQEQIAEIRNGNPIGRKKFYQGSPFLLLRCNNSFEKIDGVKKKSVMVQNTARVLKPGVIEQNVVGATRSIDPANRVLDQFSEVVIRLTSQKQNPKLILCQIAQVDYNSKGTRERSAYLQGWLTPGWRSCASEIERRTGWTLKKLGYTELVSATDTAPLQR